MNDAEIPTVPICLGSRSSVDMGLPLLKARKSPKNWNYWVTVCKSSGLYNSEETERTVAALMAMCISRGGKAMERLAYH